jgi:uncharacterized SAM-binding protein YcdF (DUF218 family)
MSRPTRRPKSSFRSAPSGTVRSSTWISRSFFVIGLTSICAICTGFVWFGDHIASLQAPASIEPADGAAALTGGSDARLKTGVQLVERGIVPRLLISGVNRVATVDEVRLVAGGKSQTYSCCIDLGKSATDTVSNATEVSDWVARYRVRRLILITDNYHMPRSLFEVRRANPDLVIIPYPVAVGVYADKNWWKSERATRGLALEYGKFIVAIGRSYVDDLFGTKTA